LLYFGSSLKRDHADTLLSAKEETEGSAQEEAEGVRPPLGRAWDIAGLLMLVAHGQ
jgi:hypothetical protein